jgi:hypothetical protein
VGLKGKELGEKGEGKRKGQIGLRTSIVVLL